eukprot:10911851-Alexandrium_andersonii.AAC.1
MCMYNQFPRRPFLRAGLASSNRLRCAGREPNSRGHGQDCREKFRAAAASNTDDVPRAPYCLLYTSPSPRD